jgi:hypothetical protein
LKRTPLKRKTPLKAKTPLRACSSLKPKCFPGQSKSRTCCTKKKRAKKTASIIHSKNGTCYICMQLKNNFTQYECAEEHHIFFGTSKRKLSEEYGLKVYLCRAHHRGDIKGNKEAVHHNQNINMLLRAAGQRAFERTHTREEFIKIFQENHLIENQEGESQCLINLENLIQ